MGVEARLLDPALRHTVAEEGPSQPFKATTMGFGSTPSENT